MDLRAQLEDRLRNDRDSIIEFCQDLVRIPSENPPGDTTQLYDFVSSYLEGRGVDYQTVAPQPTMPNLLASFEGGETGKHLVLNGHLDVFPAGDPEGWSDDPFSGIVRDGKLFGRGVIDMKVGTAASILTYIYLSEMRQHLKGKLSLTAVSDEETFGTWGTQYLLGHYPDLIGDCVLNGEPSTPHVVRIGERGMLWTELTVRSRGGHGGHVRMSSNAIVIAAEIICQVQDLVNQPVNMPEEIRQMIEAARSGYDELVGPGSTDDILSVTVNVGTVEGGEKINLIPWNARSEIDFRCPVGVPNEQVIDAFEEIVAAYPEASFDVLHRNQPNHSDPNHPMVGIVQENAESVRGIRPFPNISLAGTDCRFWRLRGVPAFVYGPTPHNMGAPDEYAEIDDLLGTVWVHALSALDYLTTAES